MKSDSALHRSVVACALIIPVVVMLSIALPVQAGAGPDAAPSPSPDLKGAARTQGNSDHLTLGAGVAWVPRFQGADAYRVQPLPLIDVKWGRFFARTGKGIGVDVIETPTLSAGISINWMQGYDSSDVPDGIRELDSALGARIFFSKKFEGMTATVAITQAVTEEDRGLTVNVGVAYPINATERLSITPSIDTTWANGKYMNSYFGIDAVEAAASGLARYQPSSGFKDVSFRLGINYRLTDSINLVGSVGVLHSLDKATKSEIVEKKTNPIALFGMTYTF